MTPAERRPHPPVSSNTPIRHPSDADSEAPPEDASLSDAPIGVAPITISPTPRPAVILFDLDGTLTAPLLDFERIRRDMGIASGQPILEALEEMQPAARDHANAKLLHHEREAAEAATLNAGCRELLELVQRLTLPTAIITRNSLDSTRIVLDRHGLQFDVLVTRADEPYKPRPQPVWLALERLQSQHPRQDVWMVGDGEHDVAAANAAGVRSVWLSHGKPARFLERPWLTVPTLPVLHGLLADAFR